MLLSREGVSLLVWLVVFTVIITVVVAFRFWAASIKRRALRPDDYMIIVAYVGTLTLEALTWWSIANGLGADTAELDMYEVGVQYKVLLSAGFTWLFATVSCKLSILLFYTCIFTTKYFKFAARILMFIVFGYGIAFTCIFFTNCHPISYSWDPVPGGYCKGVKGLEISSVSLNMVLDTAVVILPMPPLWGLQMATRNKVAITFLFSLGLLVVAVMGWRIQMTAQSVTQTDLVHGLGNIDLVTLLEVWIGIIVACLPTLTPLYSRYLSSVVSRISRKRTKQRQLKEAQHTIGSNGSRIFNKKNFNRLNKEASLLELEEGKNFSNAETTVRSSIFGEGDDY